MGCYFCGSVYGTLATIPGWGPYVYCTPCRRLFAPEGWMPAKGTGLKFQSEREAYAATLTCEDEGGL